MVLVYVCSRVICGEIDEKLIVNFLIGDLFLVNDKGRKGLG